MRSLNSCRRWTFLLLWAVCWLVFSCGNPTLTNNNNTNQNTTGNTNPNNNQNANQTNQNTNTNGNQNANTNGNQNANTNANVNNNQNTNVNTNQNTNANNNTNSSSGVTYHKDVRAIITKSCEGCHYKGGIGLFPLTSFDLVKTYAEAIKGAVTARRMPPYPADSSCQEYHDNPSLSQQDIDTISKWVESGKAEGNPADYKEPKDLARNVGLSRVDLTLSMPTAYTPLKQPDDYRCFVIPWPQKEDVYVSGFQVKAGNPALVHHVIAYIGAPKDAAKFQKLSDSESGPGYECFGGPRGNAQWLGAWAPGTPGGDYPEGTGVLVQKGSVIIVQMHYNTLQKKPSPDQTSIQLKVDKKVDKQAFFVPLASSGWTIPAGQKEYKHTRTFKNPLPVPVTIHSVMFHMHLLGTSGRLFLEKADGSKACLLNIPRWDFNWQLAYRLKQSIVATPNDRIGIECVWNNSAENQAVVDGKRLKPRDVRWGDGSTDEMCLGILYITP